MFEGFTPQTGEFLMNLTVNNERPWFLEHKEEFERVLNTPFKALAQDTAQLMQSRHPQLNLQLHVARIYRDARRLFGRGPYKDHLWFSLKNLDGLLLGPMFWFEIGAVEYSFGMGFYSATPAQTDAFRASLDANPARFERIIRKIQKTTDMQPDCEMYKRPKKDMGKLLNPWYNCRRAGLTATYPLEDGAFSPELPQKLAEEFEKLIPLYNYLMEFCALT